MISTQEGSNLLNPYNYVDSNLTYDFETDSGVLYASYFTDASSYFPEDALIKDEIRSFGFAPVHTPAETSYLSQVQPHERHTKHDPRIKDTIVTILRDFLLANPDLWVISICDNHDLRERSRHKLFSQWFSHVVNHLEIEVKKYDCIIKGATEVYGFASLYLREDNSRHDLVKTAFFNINNDLISKGL